MSPSSEGRLCCAVVYLRSSASALIASPLAAQTPDPFDDQGPGPHPSAICRAREGRPRPGGRRRAGPEGAQGRTGIQRRGAAGPGRGRCREDRTHCPQQAASRRPRSSHLKFDKVPLDQAVTELATKTGFRFVVDGTKIANVKRPVTLDTGDVPFWEAVHAFYRAAGLTEDEHRQPTDPKQSSTSMHGQTRHGPLAVRAWNREPRGRSTRLVDGQARAVATDSAFRVRALPADFAQNKYDDVKGEMTFHLDVDPAPGLAVQEIIGVEIRQAVADDRRALAPGLSGPRSELDSWTDAAWAGQQIDRR